MKKFYFSGVSFVSRLALLLVLTLAGFASANAESVTGQIEFGKTYTLNKGDVLDAYFVPTSTTTAIVTGMNLIISTDPEHTQEVSQKFGGYPSWWSLEVEQGKTYYVYVRTISWTQTFSIALTGADTPLELKYRSHSEGENVNLNYEEYITYTFNEPVEYSSVKINCDGQTVVPTVTNSDGTVNVFVNKIKDLVKAGKITPGSVASIVFDGLKGKTSGNLYEGQQTSTFTFKVSSVGSNATSQVWPSEFKSYWIPGDQAGIVKLTFEDQLKQGTAVGTILYGNVEGDLGVDLYVEELTPVVDGNTITLDLTGKRRANADMITGGPYAQITVKISNIQDKDGFPVASPGQGTVGSYSNTMTYVEIPRAIVSYETTPENGGSLKGLTSMQMWLSGLNSIIFDGFLLSYEDAQGNQKEVVIPLESAVKSEVANAGDDANFTFDIPVEARDQKGYKLTLNNLVAIDGYDHAYDVTAQFDAFVLTSVTPANGTKMEALKEGQIIQVECNMASTYPEMYMMYEVEDMNPTNPDEAIVKTLSWLDRQENGSYKAVIPQNVKLVLGHTYKCTFTAWATEMEKNYKMDPIGTASVEWYGLTEPFTFSDILFESITPSIDTKLTVDDRTFVLTFDGMVTLPAENNFINTGSGTSYPFESLEGKDAAYVEQTGYYYSNIWTAVVSESFMENLDAPLQLSFKAYDMDEKLVEGNTGYEEQSFFDFTYDVANAYKDYDITPNGDEAVAYLSEFTVSYELGILPSYAVAYKDAYVMNMAREIVANVSDITSNMGSGDLITACTVKLDAVISEPGHYMLYIPENMFTLGEEQTSWKSAEKIVYYTVENKFELESDPAEGEVLSLNVIKLTSDMGFKLSGKGAITIAKEGAAAVNVTNVATNATADSEWATEATLTLASEITELGKYVLTIPAEYFIIEGSNAYSDAVTFNYEVVAKLSDPTEDWTITPAQGKVTELSSIHFTFDNYTDAAPGQGKATISYNGGAAVTIPDCDFDWAGELNMLIQSLGKTYTDAGTYVIEFPAGYFLFGPEGDVLSPAFKLTYVIEKTDGINGIVADEAGEYVVYNVAGVKVLVTTNAADLNQLASGLYIVNGVKVYIK